MKEDDWSITLILYYFNILVEINNVSGIIIMFSKA